MAHLYLDSECNSRSALIIWTNDELRFHDDMRLLEEALTRLGIRVYTARLNFHGDVEPVLRFLGWTDEHDGVGNQLVLAYFGHGEVRNGRLMGAGTNLTSLQEYLRDSCVADALSILGTCCSGAPPSMMPPNLEFGDTGVVETLAVCNGRTTAYCDDGPAPWLQGLVWQLDGLGPGDAMTVRQIAEAIRRPSRVGRLQISFTGNQGFYRKEHGRGSMWLENLSFQHDDLYRLQESTLSTFLKNMSYWREELYKSQAQTLRMGQH
ncbi:hypothetical protein LTR56_016350 [Elasticomyces elasticus]|nr:hypothetical protein LTR56_016350 [Elasticomyces elasticus]KAK3657674.1 hypothetical protein LTR22_009226 [Elasticomyces elasticus]KAK4922480.1 hypothetical protein LTR49_010180 [Elasticomyces elasticus]KAK5760567.1 hypothetical protein LTS12_009276 [Elasticomyces elasticus]